MRGSCQHNRILPQNFLCPLTTEILKDPVMDHDGHNFERSAIVHWIQKGNGVCPISHKPLHLEDLCPNRELQDAIFRWVMKDAHTQRTGSIDPGSNRHWSAAVSHDTERPLFSGSEDASESRLSESEMELDISRDERDTAIAMPNMVLFLPQERAAFALMRCRHQAQRYSEQKRFFVRVSRAVSLVVICVLVIFLATKFAKDFFA